MALEYSEEELKEYNKKYLEKYLDPKDLEEGCWLLWLFTRC